MNYKLLFLGIFLGIILSILYGYLPKRKSNSKVGSIKYHLLDSAPTIPISNFKLSNFTAKRFSIELWLFINPNALPTSSENVTKIFNIGYGNNFISLGLYSDTALKVTIKNAAATPPTPPTRTTTITPSFPLQKWVQVIISIDQHLLDLYLDGKLMKSTVNKNVINIPSDADSIIFNKSDSYASGLNVKTIPMNSKTAMQNYKDGKSNVNGTTQVSLALSKNNNVAKNFFLF